MFKSNAARVLGLSLGILSCANIDNGKCKVPEGSFSIKGYTLVHSPNRTALGMLYEDVKSDTEHNRVRVHATLNGEEVELDCPVRERCKGVFDMPVDDKRFLESQFFGCVDWESGCTID